LKRDRFPDSGLGGLTPIVGVPDKKPIDHLPHGTWTPRNSNPLAVQTADNPYAQDRPKQERQQQFDHAPPASNKTFRMTSSATILARYQE
jgi:hypothetical protein